MTLYALKTIGGILMRDPVFLKVKIVIFKRKSFCRCLL